MHALKSYSLLIRKGMIRIKQYFLLYSCNEWKAFSSMGLVGVSMDLNVIYIMVGSKIKIGDMLY